MQQLNELLNCFIAIITGVTIHQVSGFERWDIQTCLITLSCNESQCFMNDSDGKSLSRREKCDPWGSGKSSISFRQPIGNFR